MANFNPLIFKDLTIPIKNQIIIYTAAEYEQLNPKPDGTIVLQNKKWVVVQVNAFTIQVNNNPTINPTPINYQTSLLDPNSSYFNQTQNTWVMTNKNETKCLANFTSSELCDIFQGALRLSEEPYIDQSSKNITTFPTRINEDGSIKPNESSTHIQTLEWSNTTKQPSVQVTCRGQVNSFALQNQGEDIADGSPVAAYYASVNSITNVTITVIGKADRYEKGQKVRTETYTFNSLIPVSSKNTYVIARSRQDADNNTLTDVAPDGSLIHNGLAHAINNQSFNTIEYQSKKTPTQKSAYLKKFSAKALPPLVYDKYNQIADNLNSQAFLVANSTQNTYLSSLTTRTLVENNIESICAKFLEQGPWTNFAQIEPNHVTPINVQYTSSNPTDAKQQSVSSPSQNLVERAEKYNLVQKDCSFWNFSIDSISVAYDNVPIKTIVSFDSNGDKFIICTGIKSPPINLTYTCYHDDRFATYETNYLGSSPNYLGAIDTYINNIDPKKLRIYESIGPDAVKQIKRILTNPDFNNHEKREYIIDVYRHILKYTPDTCQAMNQESLDFIVVPRSSRDPNSAEKLSKSAFTKDTEIIFNEDSRDTKDRITTFLQEITDKYYADRKWVYTSSENY